MGGRKGGREGLALGKGPRPPGMTACTGRQGPTCASSWAEGQRDRGPGGRGPIPPVSSLRQEQEVRGGGGREGAPEENSTDRTVRSWAGRQPAREKSLRSDNGDSKGREESQVLQRLPSCPAPAEPRRPWRTVGLRRARSRLSKRFLPPPWTEPFFTFGMFHFEIP